jgi:hypothetical protein
MARPLLAGWCPSTRSSSSCQRRWDREIDDPPRPSKLIVGSQGRSEAFRQVLDADHQRRR